MSTEFTRHNQKLEFILRTAARIFAEKSYHSTSMRDISRETGVSLAGLYHYCSSKEELLFLIQDNCYDPKGKLKVSELVENLTRLFLSGFLGGPPDARVQYQSHLASVEPRI